MTIGNKLSRLRKENNYTQEQLSDLLGVSRQAISKWESDVAYPETDKILRLAELYHCSTDYLLKDSMEEDHPNSYVEQKKEDNFPFGIFMPERTSKKTWRGMPLWQTGKHAKGVVAIGFDAKGILAIGFMARGVISIGFLSIGIFSLGLLAIGLLSFGVLALGVLVFGSFAFGIIAGGALSFGVVSFGALARGDFSFGAYAIGKYLAIGDKAEGMVAIGKSEASGTLFEKLGELSKDEIKQAKAVLDENVPGFLGWAKSIVLRFIK